MLSRPQQILLKRAQAELGLSDSDYRDAVAAVSGMPDCRSSKDKRLTDIHLDRLMAYFEAIYWQVDRCALPGKIFRSPGYWLTKNRKSNTSRDRFTANQLESAIATAERAIIQLGYGEKYLTAIYNRTSSPRSYLAALERTLKSKRRIAPAPEPHPF